MMILWKEKLAFLAVPKTGTTAIETAMAPFASISFSWPPAVKHMTHQRFNRFIRPYLKKEGVEDIRLFAVMREPVSWLGSWYRYRQRADLAASAKSTRGHSFDEFVSAYMQTEQRPEFANLGSQARLLSKSRDEVGMDHLFRYEDLDKLLDFLESHLGVRLALEVMNASPQMDLQLSAGTKARLQKLHALDFETYANIG